MSKIPALFTPIQLRDLTVRNRIWVAPMCQYSVTERDGVPVSWHLLHYGSFARGGAGLVTVEATAVVPEGRISPQDLGLWNDEQMRAFRQITDLIRSQGAKSSIQLAHAGRKASVRRGFPGEETGVAPQAEGGWPVVAPSSVPFEGLSMPTAITAADIEGVVEAFRVAAVRAVDAGFDAIEIHGAHGYLLHEFLSPLSNFRDDNYGGSLENRARLLLQVVETVRTSVPSGMPVIVRLSATEWVPEGLGIDETLIISEWLKDLGVDLISVSSGGNLPSAPIPVGAGYQVPLAQEIRSAVEIPVAVAGLITEPMQAEQIVAIGEADAVYLGRVLLRDPNFAVRAADELRYSQGYIPAPYVRAYLR